MRAQPKIPLRTWAERNWNPPPSPRTLSRWVHNANIDPQPQKVGREYYVEPDAKLVDRNGNPMQIDGTLIFCFPQAPIAGQEARQSPLPSFDRLLRIDQIRGLNEIEFEAGVYFLFLDGSLQYVGLSVGMAHRILQHEREGRIKFDECRCLEIGDRSWREIMEREYIAYYKPPWNVAFVNRAPIMALSPAS